jgi:hypothetical protein
MNILLWLFANYLVPFILCVEKNVCIHVYIGLLIKCSLSEWFNFQSRLNKISFIYIELENILTGSVMYLPLVMNALYYIVQKIFDILLQ